MVGLTPGILEKNGKTASISVSWNAEYFFISRKKKEFWPLQLHTTKFLHHS
jgi:hypothetical protein